MNSTHSFAAAFAGHIFMAVCHACQPSLIVGLTVAISNFGIAGFIITIFGPFVSFFIGCCVGLGISISLETAFHYPLGMGVSLSIDQIEYQCDRTRTNFSSNAKKE